MEQTIMNALMQGEAPALVVGLIILVGLVVLALKGWALWIAAKNHHKIWFIVLLVVNTIGILELIYIFLVGKKALREKKVVTETVVEVETTTDEPKAAL